MTKVIFKISTLVIMACGGAMVAKGFYYFVPIVLIAIVLFAVVMHLMEKYEIS